MQEYSFTEKFFKIQPEGRIRRYQFFVRSLSFGILMGLWAYVTTNIVTTTMLTPGSFENMFKIITIDKGVWAIFTIPYLFVMYHLMIKRSYDIGWKTTILPLLIVIFQGLSSLMWVLILINLFFGQFLSSDLIGFLGTFSLLLGGIGVFSGVILDLILLFYPWKQGDNEFGKDPVNTKVSFFG